MPYALGSSTWGCRRAGGASCCPVLRWQAARQVSSGCQVDSPGNQTFDLGCCGQKAGSVVACSEAWVCVKIPLPRLGFVRTRPSAAFPTHQVSHLRHRGENQAQCLGCWTGGDGGKVPTLPPGKMWGPCSDRLFGLLRVLFVCQLTEGSHYKCLLCTLTHSVPPAAL